MISNAVSRFTKRTQSIAQDTDRLTMFLIIPPLMVVCVGILEAQLNRDPGNLSLNLWQLALTIPAYYFLAESIAALAWRFHLLETTNVRVALALGLLATAGQLYFLMQSAAWANMVNHAVFMTLALAGSVYCAETIRHGKTE
jgi:hypothetical protein